MTPQQFLSAALGGGVLLLAAAATRAADPAPSWNDVAPIFERACVHCHAGGLAVQGLALDSAAGVRKGSSTGPVVVVGDPAQSRLVMHLRGTLKPQMPFDGDPLPEAEIAAIEGWIKAGAPAPAPAPAPVPLPAPAPGPAALPVPAPVPSPALAEAPLRWRDVAPILRANCVRCHQAKGLQGGPPEGLRLDSLEALLSSERAFVVPGRPEASPIVRAVKGLSKKRMPLGGPPFLSDADISRLVRWVKEGARDDAGKPMPVPVGRRLRLFGVLDGAGGVDGLAFVRNGAARAADDHGPERDGHGADDHGNGDRGRSRGGGRGDRNAHPEPGQRVEARFVIGAQGELLLERLRPE